jgi:L-lactate dehydrogenase (cytochrome)
MAVITCNEDLRQLARRRVPRAIFDYVDRGSYDELTLNDNRRDLMALRLRQRVMVDVSRRSLECTLLGEKAAMPVALAPTGLTGLMHARGEILAAQAAEAAGIPFTLSTMSICSIEDVAAHCRKPFWFQLYVMRDRDFVSSLIRRARLAGCSALVLTADLQIQGQRHQDLKNGLSVPPRLTAANLLDLACKPAWSIRQLLGRRTSFGNLAGFLPKQEKQTSMGQWIMSQFEPAMSWDDVAWIKAQWPGKLIIKGLLDPEDARLAVDAGADAIVVSNHGGRQLDGAISSIAALPAIVEALDGRTEILFDGGVRTGQDVLKALALGAQGVMIGKAFLYGLGAMGKEGVALALALIRKELDISMALTGSCDVTKVGPELLYR